MHVVDIFGGNDIPDEIIFEKAKVETPHSRNAAGLKPEQRGFKI